MFISPAFAQGAGDAVAPGMGSSFLIPMGMVFVIFYFLIIRPQNKRAKQHREMVGGTKRGDTVVTAGGIIGKVSRVHDDEISLEIADGVKIRVVKATLSDVRVKGEAAAND